MSNDEQKLCQYCRKPIETLVKEQIIFRDWNSVTRRQFVNTKVMDFCSKQCAHHEQCSREG